MRGKIESLFGFLIFIVVFLYSLPLLIIVGLVFLIVWISELPFKKKKIDQSRKDVLMLAEKDKKIAYLQYDRNYSLSDLIESDFIPRYDKYLLTDLVDGNKYKISERFTYVVEQMKELAEVKEISGVDDENDCNNFAARLLIVKKDGSVNEFAVPITEDGNIKVKESLTMFQKAMQTSVGEWNLQDSVK